MLSLFPTWAPPALPPTILQALCYLLDITMPSGSQIKGSLEWLVHERLKIMGCGTNTVSLWSQWTQTTLLEQHVLGMPSRTPTAGLPCHPHNMPTSFQSLDSPDASPVQELDNRTSQTLSCCSIFFLLFIELHLFFIGFPSLWHIFSHKSFIHFFSCFILLIFNISESILFLPFFSILISNVAVVFNWFTQYFYIWFEPI